MSRRSLATLALSGLLALSGGLLTASAAGASTPGRHPASVSAKDSNNTKPTVFIAKVKGLGKVLVDSENRTLYSLVHNHKPVACTGACLDVWVPLTINPGSKPTAGKGVSGLGVVNGNQVTEHHFPLFLFSGDKAHEANGQGMTTSGGTWHALKVTSSSSGSKKGGGSNAGTGGVSF